MTALSTVYKIVKEQHRPTDTPATATIPIPLIRDPDSPSVVLCAAADSKVTSSTSADDLPAVEPPLAVQDLSLAGQKLPVMATVPYERAGDPGTWDGGCCYYGGPSTDTTLVAAHTTRNRVDISLSSVERPPPAHTSKVDITGYTYIVRNSCDAPATDE